jgi:hypothetical protein
MPRTPRTFVVDPEQLNPSKSLQARDYVEPSAASSTPTTARPSPELERPLEVASSVSLPRRDDGTFVKPLWQLAQEAIDMQDACNLSGVVHSWHRSISDLRLHGRAHPTLVTGTAWLNEHPINRLFASKVHDLTGMGLSESLQFGLAYEECKQLVASKKEVY